MLIDASKHSTTRAAIREAMATALTGPGTSLVIEGTLSIDGCTLVPVRRVQITVAQVTPGDWKLFTECDGDKLTLYRWT